ncbi:peptidyl-tRNA hydrolase PTH2-domain-containing protein [Infundibulicybe gibba]|nr:peptidyl-tRNA hydrolase PTH2-domain-containing protein [Infundibulicybe gibba]
MENATAYALLATTSLGVGYWFGRRLRIVAGHVNLSETVSLPKIKNVSRTKSAAEGDSLPASPRDECKLVLVVRMDLGMSSGKIAAHHATLACYKALSSANPVLLHQWERSGQTKVALRCSDENELLLLEAQAQNLRLCARSIRDAGRTQIAAGSRTVLGIVGPTRMINQVTGKLRLL